MESMTVARKIQKYHSFGTDDKIRCMLDASKVTYKVLWCAHLVQVKGFIGRYITYTGPEFKEGLSLTVHDEITRWRKYAFGCSELVFNPLKQWMFRCFHMFHW